MSNVDAVAREGGWEASSEVIPWKLAENPADPVVSAVSRRCFPANFHGITLDDASQPPSLATASTLDISELASVLSSTADDQTA